MQCSFEKVEKNLIKPILAPL